MELSDDLFADITVLKTVVKMSDSYAGGSGKRRQLTEQIQLHGCGSDDLEECDCC